MLLPRLPWPALALALAGAAGIVAAGGGFWLAGAVLLLWLGTLLMSRPAPVAPVESSIGMQFTRDRIESLLEPLDAPLLMIDGERIRFANAAARAVLGGHIVGQDVRVALRHPDAVALTAREGTATVAGLTGPRSVWEVSRRRIDDRLAMIELANRTVEADTARAHTDFVANASHELSTPLASIIGYVETLAESGATVEPGTASRFHGIVLREARRLQSLVQDLMSLSRIEAEKHDRPRKPVDLGQLVASVANEVASTRSDKRIRIEAPTTPAMIEGDRGQLDQLTRNLVDNALKYGDQDEAVRVAVEAVGNQVVMAVSDRGPGIAPQHLPHLTRRFYRTDPGRSRAAGGTGLGLAIVKHIVERHRGTLDISSRQGEGTTVTVRLPELPPEAPSA